MTASQSQVALDSVGTPSVSRPGAPPLKGHAVGSAEKPDRPGPERGTWSFGQVDAGARAAVAWDSCVASVTWRRALGEPCDARLALASRTQPAADHAPDGDEQPSRARS